MHPYLHMHKTVHSLDLVAFFSPFCHTVKCNLRRVHKLWSENRLFLEHTNKLTIPPGIVVAHCGQCEMLITSVSR